MVQEGGDLAGQPFRPDVGALELDAGVLAIVDQVRQFLPIHRTPPPGQSAYNFSFIPERVSEQPGLSR